ncbi:MAG: AzlD domain-containing protein [Kofleriaceae bacterium]|nr:AzlD domain-containing protein [Kofleriaceae bacterium]
MTWTLIIMVGVATFALRASFLVAAGEGANPLLTRVLRFVPVVVLPPLAVSAVINNGGSTMEVRFLCAAVAALIGWRTGNAAAAMIAGMVVLWLFLFL